MAESTWAVKPKWKRTVLSIEDNVDIIKQLESSSANVIAERYGVGKSTVLDIKKNRDKILLFQEMHDMGMSKKAKVMKVWDDKQDDKAVYLWFKQKRMEGIPISGPILCEEVVQLHKKMYGEESSFSGSTGWQWRFCKRHGIRNLSLECEKLSADTEASATFITSFNEFVEEHQLTLNQIFNCDETGLNFHLLLNKTLAAFFEHSADGRKLSKERVTINACANATGTIKLPLQVIGKAKRPKCVRGLRMELLPVEYCSQKSVWMNSKIFHAWFHNSFIPTVRKELSSLLLEPEAVLVLDNFPAHPNEEDLISDDGNITTLYLPPNVTSLIQTMDQGVLVALKSRYKKILLQRLLIEDENDVSLINFLKSVNMKIVTELIAESWGEIKESTPRKSWWKIMPIKEPKESEDQTEGQEDGDEDEQEFIREFRSWDTV